MTAITDKPVETLRAYVRADFDRFERLFALLDKDARRQYMVLVSAAFFEAVDRRFAEHGTHKDVVEFVGAVRAWSDWHAERVDPVVAERLIRHSLGDGSIDDLDSETVVGTQQMLLGSLVTDEHFDDKGMDAFMAEARRLAEGWLG